MIFLMVVLQLLSGMGVVQLLGRFSPVQQLSLGMILGLAISSVVLFLLDCMGIRLTGTSLLVGMVAATGLSWAFGWRRSGFPEFSVPRVRLYEAPAILILALLCLVSLWRTVLLPVSPRDAIVGMDLVARFAVLEGTLNSSVFTSGYLDGQLSNQPFYAPFTALMQTAFRLAGFASGKLWIFLLFSSFTVFLYSRLRQVIHPLLAGFLTVALMSTQGLFTYAFHVITDMANALYFGLGVLFLFEYTQAPSRRKALLAALLFGVACWSRSDSILLVPVGAALMWIGGAASSARGKDVILFLSVPLALFLAWHWFYFTFRFDAAPESGAFTQAVTLSAVLGTLQQMANLVYVSKLLGTLPYLFTGVLVLDVALSRRRLPWLYVSCMVGVVCMLLFLVHAFPAASMEYTGKRGFIKVLVVMALYLAVSPTMVRVGGWLQGWGESGPAAKGVRSSKRKKKRR